MGDRPEIGIRQHAEEGPSGGAQQLAEVDPGALLAEGPSCLVLQRRYEEAPGALPGRHRIDHHWTDHVAHEVADLAELEIAIRPRPLQGMGLAEGPPALPAIAKLPPAGVRR